MNISFDGIELSEYGFSLSAIDGRGMPEWQSNVKEIVGFMAIADVSTGFTMGTQTTCEGMLSSDTLDWSMHTHAELMKRRDALFNDVINPAKGYRKLVVSGDLPDRWRWARGISAAFPERLPVFSLPFEPLTIVFLNYEPFWRESAPEMNVSNVPTALPMTNAWNSSPRIEILIGDSISAYRGARIQPVNLLTIDDFQLNWKGTPDVYRGTLRSGDTLIVDSASMTAVIRPATSGTMEDVIRHYDYGGPGAYAGNGFPTIKRGGSTLLSIHPHVASVRFKYDYLFL